MMVSKVTAIVLGQIDVDAILLQEIFYFKHDVGASLILNFYIGDAIPVLFYGNTGEIKLI